MNLKNPSDHFTVCQTIFFPKTFYTWTSMTIPQSHRPGFLNPVCETMVWSLKFKVKNVFEKKWKNPVCETVVWSLVDWVKNLIEKKMPRSVRQWYGHWRVKKIKTFEKNNEIFEKRFVNCLRKHSYPALTIVLCCVFCPHNFENTNFIIQTTNSLQTTKSDVNYKQVFVPNSQNSQYLEVSFF